MNSAEYYEGSKQRWKLKTKQNKYMVELTYFLDVIQKTSLGGKIEAVIWRTVMNYCL